MRMAFVMGASLLATACGGQQDGERADQGAAIAQPDAASDAGGAFAAQAPSAQDFAQSVAMADMYEIAAANLVAQKVKTGPTREFANMMIADHTKSSAALKEAITASGRSLALPAKLDAEHQALIDALKTLNGPDLEREYMSQQTAAHRKALDLLKSYAGSGDTADLRQFAQGAIPAVQKHYDWLETNAPGTATMRETPEATGGTPGAGSAAPAP